MPLSSRIHVISVRKTSTIVWLIRVRTVDFVSTESAITLALVLLDSLNAIVRKISTNVPS